MNRSPEDTESQLDFAYLADRPEAIPLVARWWFDEWGHLRPDRPIDKIAEQIREELNPDELPIQVLGLVGDEVAGVAVLKLHEMEDVYPDKQYWLGGVFVAPGNRRKGIGSAVAMKVVHIADSLGIRDLHLQTERLDGGLYARLGWRELEKVQYKGDDVLVMVKPLHR